jgi:hypothetical protein
VTAAALKALMLCGLPRQAAIDHASALKTNIRSKAFMFNLDGGGVMHTHTAMYDLFLASMLYHRAGPDAMILSSLF